MIFILAVTILAIIGFFSFSRKRKNDAKWILPSKPFPASWRIILTSNISYYTSLSETEKERFEYKIQEFLLNCKITGVKTNINAIDKILVASSAVIPIFGFDTWRYLNLNEVLIYPTMFNEKFETEGSDRRILGMVGNGYMEGIMILSQQALKLGFQNESDKKNTAIHEFVHLIDKTDGPIDGIPSSLMEKQYAIPWIDFINKKLDEIYDGKSDINPYGGTNRAEFFSVTSEYFFERPKLLKRKHPDLYYLLEKVFNQDMSTRNFKKKTAVIKRNSHCPCNSGKKYKKCCALVLNN
jgi:Mlc titration factor MtfA (ptsG expression regulator)